MKAIKKTTLFLLIISLISVIINAKTRFFKDIGDYIPALETNYPHVTETISDISDMVNEFISRLPTPSELYANIRHVELPIDPEDVAANAYYSSNSMLNFYSAQNFSVSVSDDEADVYGILTSGNEKHLVYRFLDADDNVLEQFTDSVDADGNYRKIMTIPDGTHQLTIFTGAERFGNYSSQVFNYVYLEKNAEGAWQIALSPVTQHNITEYEKAKSISAALKSTYAVCAGTDSVISLARSITSGLATNYEKAAALHDWICNNIYYDTDSIVGEYNTAPYVATDVLEKKRAVCLGYANLYASLCRAISIPCNVVTGYALGVTGSHDVNWNENNINTEEANHAWNEVYIDNRWVIVDTTWDCRNKIENGTTVSEGETSHLYFDANIMFFSSNHKIIDYPKR